MQQAIIHRIPGAAGVPSGGLFAARMPDSRCSLLLLCFFSVGHRQQDGHGVDSGRTRAIVAWKMDSRVKLFACSAGAASIMDDCVHYVGVDTMAAFLLILAGSGPGDAAGAPRPEASRDGSFSLAQWNPFPPRS